MHFRAFNTATQPTNFWLFALFSQLGYIIIHVQYKQCYTLEWPKWATLVLKELL